MTGAERQARAHARRLERLARLQDALERILEVRTARKARAIAAEALGEEAPGA